MTITTPAIMALMTRRRTRRLPRLGPLPLVNLLDHIEAEHPGADVIELQRRRRLTLAPAARQRRAA